MKIFQTIAGIGLVLIITFLFVGCDNTTPTPPPTTTTSNGSLLPTQVTTGLNDWNGANVISVPRGTQGQIGNVRIGLSSTGAENYVNKNGDMQRGMVASIQLFAKDGPTEYKSVYLGQTFEFGEYAFFVIEIRPTNLKTDSPPGASGGGLVELLCIPTTDFNKKTSPGTDTTPITWSWIPSPGNVLNNDYIAYFPEGGAYVQSGKTFNLVWLADKSVEAHILAEKQFDEVRDTGNVTASLAYGSGKIGSIDLTVKESGKYYAVVMCSSESGSSVILYNAVMSTKVPAPGSTSTSGSPNLPPQDLSNTNPPPPLQAPVFTLALPRTNCSVQLPVLGGVPPYSWSIWSGQLPDGYQLESSGYITGALRGTGGQMSLSGMQMMVKDSAGTIVMVKHDGGVSNDNSFIYGYVRAGYYNPAVQPGIKQNPAVAYTDSIFHFSPFVTGGVRPLTFFANGLPQGLNCDPSTGIIEGTPARSAAGQVYYVLVYGKDAAGHTMTGAENAGVYITVVDRSPAPTITSTGTIPGIVGAWHGTLSGSGTFTMNIDKQNGSNVTGVMDLTFPGNNPIPKAFEAQINSDGTMGFSISATGGSWGFRFDGKVQGNAVSGTFSGWGSDSGYSGTWLGTRP